MWPSIIFLEEQYWSWNKDAGDFLLSNIPVLLLSYQLTSVLDIFIENTFLVTNCNCIPKIRHCILREYIRSAYEVLNGSNTKYASENGRINKIKCLCSFLFRYERIVFLLVLWNDFVKQYWPSGVMLIYNNVVTNLAFVELMLGLAYIAVRFHTHFITHFCIYSKHKSKYALNATSSTTLKKIC